MTVEEELTQKAEQERERADALAKEKAELLAKQAEMQAKFKVYEEEKALANATAKAQAEKAEREAMQKEFPDVPLADLAGSPSEVRLVASKIQASVDKVKNESKAQIAASLGKAPLDASFNGQDKSKLEQEKAKRAEQLKAIQNGNGPKHEDELAASMLNIKMFPGLVASGR